MFKSVESGVKFMLLSSLFSAVNGAVAKILSDEISALEIVFFRNLLGVLIILFTLKHTPALFSKDKLGLLLVRGFMGFSAMIMFFYTITSIPLGVAITLNKTSPFFVAILAFWLLNERATKKSVAAVFIGFIGVLLITSPNELSISYEHVLGLLGGFFAAAAYTTIRKIKDHFDSRIIVLSFMGVGTVIPFFMFLLASVYTPPEYLKFLIDDFSMPETKSVWFYIGLMAVIATISQWLLTKAYSSSNATVIGVVSYTNIPFAIGFGMMLGDPIPSLAAFCGIVLIVLGGLLVKKGS
ncbi:MAG: DMT family transporter [Campylobacterota bacterium]|nr:DMT family transporter [Campylobacterota bacterium]